MALEETVLLNFDIDNSGSLDSINELRAANKFLTAERNKVNVATKEGQEELKKINTLIDKNNKLIKDNSSALEKQRQNVGNYSKSIQEAAGSLNIMGTNVGALGTKLTSFVNPATAAVAVVSALGAAYASSTIGARDLEFASNQLAAATGLLANSFASMVSSAEDGEGAVTKILNSALEALGPAGLALSATSKALAQAKEDLQDLARNEIIARGVINERLAENQELMTKIQDSQTDINEKSHLAGEIIDNLRLNETDLLAIKNAQLKVIEDQLRTDQTNEALLDAQAIKMQEISVIKRDTERKVGAINRLESNLLDTYNKQAAALDEANTKRKLAGVKTDGTISTDRPLPGLTNAGDQEIQISNETTAVVVANNERKIESAEEYLDRVISLQEQEAGAARNLAGTLASIAEEGTAAQKALALVTIAINSGIGVSEAVKAGAGIPWPANLSAILSGITAVLAGIDQARGLLGFAEGGWTGPGSKYTPVGVVHADEYVTPKHIVHTPAAQPHLRALERMRTGYADGGFVTNTNMQSSREAMLMANTLRNLPPGIVQVVDINKVQKTIAVKERVSSR